MGCSTGAIYKTAKLDQSEIRMLSCRVEELLSLILFIMMPLTKNFLLLYLAESLSLRTAFNKCLEIISQDDTLRDIDDKSASSARTYNVIKKQK
jgi:hypothetical protein